MIVGETVHVALLATTTTTGEARDRLGNQTRTYATPVAVTNVVVAPASSEELGDLRPDGMRAVYTLHFPRGYGQDLRGAKVTVRGHEYHVMGDPEPYTEANVRGPWTMPVTVGRHDG